MTTPPAVYEQVGQLESETGDDVVDGAASEAVHQDTAIAAFADGQRGLPIMMCRAPRREAATGFLDSYEARQDARECGIDSR
jgi:hypothetical protein